MSEFLKFKQKIQEQFNNISKEQLFTVEVDKDLLWQTYLNSFPEGTNPMYRERTEYDCNCCKQFIRRVGNVVAIIDNKFVSIWDITIDNFFQEVTNQMSKFIKSKVIENLFRATEQHAGTDKSNEIGEDGKVRTWNHLYVKIPNNFVIKGVDIGAFLGNSRANKEVFKRSMEEITLESAETILELIEQNSLYRGAEHKGIVELFIKHKKIYNKTLPQEKDNYCWATSVILGGAGRIRNTVIGTLLEEISFGDDLDKAVKSFESKVAPANYKRPTALITKGMIEQAQKKVEELGIENSLLRRHAIIDDITINNVLFANRDVKKTKNVFDELKKDVAVNIKNFDKVEEVDIETFIKNILPKANSIELLVENKHTPNFVTLVAPVHKDAPNILKWDNNFSWSYNGEVADSNIREAVKAKGGRVDGVFRFSHSWNHRKRNASLMDLHVFMPGSDIKVGNPVNNIYGNGERVGWNNRKHLKSLGVQDVDYTDPAPVGYIPVENTTFPYLDRMPEGTYICKIHNWQLRQPTQGGFCAEIEFNNQIFTYEYDKPLGDKEWITVAEVTLKNGEFSIKHHLPESNTSKNIWNIETQKFIPVTMVMNSPNYWDGNETGNKHYFFMLQDCKIPGQVRGFYNEFLNNELMPHRKVFEMLSSKMKVEESDQQLTGIGFSSTIKNSILCKVTGSFSRTIKLIF